MKKLFLFILFAFLFLSSRSQVITGTVFDNASKQVIGYASLYFTGTFIGTTTDKNGNFELDVTKNKNMPLTVSAIGYYSTNIDDFLSGKPVKIYLGSRIHFFRVLWLNQLNSSSFIVKNSSDQKLKCNEIVITSGNKKYLRYFEPLKIGYHSLETTGRLVFLSTLVYFDATGYYDQTAVQWEGTMADRRIADGLPYEYSPEP